jgi:hypothetical protein
VCLRVSNENRYRVVKLDKKKVLTGLRGGVGSGFNNLAG